MKTLVKKLMKPSARAPAAAHAAVKRASSKAAQLADRRMAKSGLPVWRRGTLVLVA